MSVINGHDCHYSKKCYESQVLLLPMYEDRLKLIITLLWDYEITVLQRFGVARASADTVPALAFISISFNNLQVATSYNH